MFHYIPYPSWLKVMLLTIPIRSFASNKNMQHSQRISQIDKHLKLMCDHHILSHCSYNTLTLQLKESSDSSLRNNYIYNRPLSTRIQLYIHLYLLYLVYIYFSLPQPIH